ncbi:hypothetical protein KC19_1G130600 [Ceratodon purpureus]|uniref:DnaJ homologue subfamily C GRV2/DNAJC13 N-terminal domain-containing protein n=1 Tax=Ceratodon purpureus TaxID=3225 RepID=A0A8T0J4K8_CERPU|nr:hypothetical protein KC19_1G130600 [Ceratodon purpureus]
MDYQIFLVRQAASGRTPWGGLRILRILDHGVSVSSLATPNAAPTEYKFEHVSKVLAGDDDQNELRLEVVDSSKSGFGTETVRLSCEARTSLVTALFNRLDDLNGIGIDYAAKKDSSLKGGLADTILRVRSASIVKMVKLGHRPDSKATASKKINFQDIVKLELLSDDEEIVLISLKSRTVRLVVSDSVGFLSAIQRNMKTNLKRDIEIEKIETSVMTDYYTERYKKVREYPILYEFQALKPSRSLKKDIPRTLRITKHLLIESTQDELINVHSLEDLLGVVACETNDKEVILEFTSWKDCHFLLKDRDDFLASVADVMGMEKGSTFSIRLEPFHSFTFPEQQNALHQGECETFYLNRFIAAYNSTREAMALHLPLKEYAANILVGESQCTDVKILQVVSDTLKETLGKPKPDFVRAATCCMVLVRLLGSKPCFDAIRISPEIATTLFQCVRSKNTIISYHATLVIRSAIKLAVQPGSADAGIASKQEFGNRSSVLTADSLQQLVALLQTLADTKNSSLQVIGILDVLTFALSSPPTDNDAGRLWLRAYEASITQTADLLCTFFRVSSDVIYTRLSILLQALLTMTSPVACKHLQSVCLGRCVLLLHLSTAVFSKKPHLRLLSCSQIFFLMKGNSEARRLLMSVLPQGVMNLYAKKVTDIDDKEIGLIDDFSAWKDTIELLHSGNIETPLLVWNDIKRAELRKFLRDEMEGYYSALESDDDLWYNSADVQLIYSTASEGGGSVVNGVHLELLVDHQPPGYSIYSSFWKLGDPVPLFQSVFQAMLLGFTPLFGNNNLPEIDLRLAVHVLTWIYDRNTEDIASCMETLKVIETVVGMLREVIDSEHEVFVFKLVIFLLATLERGDRENVVRFVRAGGASVMASLMVLSVEKSCENKLEFESDGWTSKGALAQGQFEILNYVGSDGMARMVRVPSGMTRGVSVSSVKDGSLEAKDGIKWQDRRVPPKIQLGLVLDQLETLLRVSGDVVSNKQYYPPSAAVLSLSKVETLCQLVQVLLRLRSPEFGRVLEIVTNIAKENRSAMTKLYSLGAFEILLWKFLAGDLVDSDKDMVCKFLLQCHLVQDQDTISKKSENDQSPCKNSALRMYLPDGLILRLMSEDMDSYKVFATVLDTDEDAPDIIWNMDMRQRLVDNLSSQLEPYVRARASDSMALYVHSRRAPVNYPELADMVFSAPFYLQNLLDEERYHGYPINEPDVFLSSLMLDLRSLANAGESIWNKEIKRIQLLLKALAYIVDRFPLKLPSDTEELLITMASPALQTCLSQNEGSDQVCIEILQHTVKVLRRVVAVKMKGGDFPQESLNFALDILSLGTRWSTNNSFDLALVGSVSLLEVISSKDYARSHLWDDSRWQEGMQWALSSAVSDNTAVPPRGPSPVSYHSLNSLKHFAGDSDYSQRIVDEGFYLPLLLLIVPSVDSKSESAISTMPISAADVLGSFVRGERTERSSLSKLIPRPLLSCLKNDEDLGRFINMAGSDIQNPTTMWTADVRAELRMRAQEQIARRKEGTNEDEATWLRNFEYACLQKDFVIGGVYVSHLAFGNLEGGDLPDNTEFLDLMMEHLERERNVVSMADVGNDAEEYEDKHVIFSEGMQEQRSQAAELEKYLLVLVASRECLRFAVSLGRNDLVKCFKLQTFLEIASMDQCAPKVWTELMYIFKELAHYSTNHDVLLQSNLLRLAGVYLWDAVTDDKGDETKIMLLSTLDMLLFLSENIPATVEVTNYFSSSGIFFPLLCLFCDVDMPSLRTGIVETGKIASRQRLFAACILGQLLLCCCGVSQRVSFLGESAEPKDPFSESKKIRVMTTDVDDLMMLLEPGNHGAKPLVFQTLMFLMPLELLSTLAHNPARACNLYKETVYNPRLVWDDETRRRVHQTLTKEAIKLQAFVKNQVVSGLGSWALELEEPVFTRWILATLSDDERKPLYKNSSEESYVPEMYLGGFFLDQFLRIPEYFFGTILEQRFLREVKKAIVLDLFAEDPDSLRRVLLALLLLFKGRPYLLSGKSYIDIFLAVNRLIVSTGAEARILAQPAIILTHSIANHKDIIDCIGSEDLVLTLISFLDLDVPSEAAGFAGTDPRLCSLLLLRRLLRLSPPTVEITSNVAFLQKLADTALDVDGSKEVSKAARECLCLMCHDKRKGKEIIRLVDSLVPVDSVGFWDIPVDSIRDDIAGFDVLQHFLRHQCPCSWWNSDKTKELTNDEVSSTTGALDSRPATNGVSEHHEDQEILKTTASGKLDGQLLQNHSS